MVCGQCGPFVLIGPLPKCSCCPCAERTGGENWGVVVEEEGFGVEVVEVGFHGHGAFGRGIWTSFAFFAWGRVFVAGVEIAISCVIWLRVVQNGLFIVTGETEGVVVVGGL